MIRLWYFAENRDTPYKIVFLDSHSHGSEFNAYSVLEAAGITRERIEIIIEPTQFDKIIVPEETFYSLSGHYKKESLKIFDLICSKVKPSKYKKIYLSRTAFKRGDTFNEKYFEEFYSKRGYRIIFPEQLDFIEQVSLIYGADEVVYTKGTLGFMLLFAKPGTRVVMFDRSSDFNPAFISNQQRRELDYIVLESVFNFLPTAHTGSRNKYFYGHTIYWKQYLDAYGIPYEEDEISFEKQVKPIVYDYLIEWAKNYAEAKFYTAIHNRTLIDVVNGIHKVFLQK